MVDIEIGSNLFTAGNFILSWHGFFSFIAVATAVYLVGRWAPMKGIDPDDIYSIAIWAIIGGVIGARAVHVADNWGYYSANPTLIAAVWAGGIGIWGGILGGFIGGVTYALIKKFPLSTIGAIADLTAPVMLLSQSIGRLGDIVNGEHCARALDSTFAWVWTNPVSDAAACENINGNGIGDAIHPVIAYEILWNFISLIIVWKLRDRLRPNGMLWAVYLALYAVGRFAIAFARTDNLYALGLQESQYIAIAMLAIAIPVMIIKARPAFSGASANGEDGTPPLPSRPRGTRAQRRRRERDR